METTFRITRFPKHSNLCDLIVELAAKSNGLPIDSKLTINDFVSVAKCEMIRYPSSNDGTVMVKLDEHHLMIDKNGEPALEIIEVEVVDFPNDIMDDYEHSAN